MEYDETSARKLLEELDEDKSGLIDFQEFCAFIARVKCVVDGLWRDARVTLFFHLQWRKGLAVRAGFVGVLTSLLF